MLFRSRFPDANKIAQHPRAPSCGSGFSRDGYQIAAKAAPTKARTHLFGAITAMPPFCRAHADELATFTVAAYAAVVRLRGTNPFVSARPFQYKGGVIMRVISVILLVLMAVTATVAIGQAGDATPQPPSVNQPVQRQGVPAVIGPQYVREPFVKQPVDHEPEIQQLRAQLANTNNQIAALQKKRDALSALNAQDSQRLQQFMDSKAKAEQQLSDVMKQSSDNAQTIIPNTK